jgi:hypothetical protein
MSFEILIARNLLANNCFKKRKVSMRYVLLIAFTPLRDNYDKLNRFRIKDF